MFKHKDAMVKDILVQISKKKPEREGAPEGEPEEDAGLEAAAEEILEAVRARDAAGLAQALKSFIEQC